MEYKILKSHLINTAVYQWTCGDGCCSTNEFYELVLIEGFTLSLEYDDWAEDYQVVGELIDGEPIRIKQWHIDEMLENEIISEDK